MSQRWCLITGATSGIGRAAAIELAGRGWAVLLVGRNRERGEAVVREIDGGASAPRAAYLPADLSRMSEVRRLAAEVRSRTPRLDGLLNNAGTFEWKRRLTPEGLETQFAVNHLGHFLLTQLLMAPLAAAPAARVVNVSSGAHRRTTIDFSNLQGEGGYNGLRAYANSKLANLLFTRELARRLRGSGVTANAMHPGVVATEILYRGSPLIRLLSPFLRSPARGADTAVYLLDAPEVAGASGEYFKDRRRVEPSPAARDDAAAERLWRESARLSEITPGEELPAPA
jgi:NAD(P)-dependent dehydrogenase (short-subunit alcohol dehydrogenase family)